MLKSVEAVIFDLDGTLIDSMWIWDQVDIEYLARFGLTVPVSLHDQIEGMSFSETAAYFKRTFQLPDSVDMIKEAWVEMARQKYLHEVPMKKGAVKFLEFLKQQGIQAGIATSNARDLVEDIIRVHGLEPYFASVRTSCEVASGKPAPDIYLKVAHDIQTDPARCLVFEDIPNGILAGKQAGMRVCAVEDAFSVYLEKEKRKLADYYIKDYEQIFEHTYEVLS